MAIGNELGIRVVILGLGEFRRASRDVRSELDSTQRKIQGLTGHVSTLGSSLQRFGSAMSSMGRALTFSFTLPLVTSMAGLIGSGIQFEEAFAGVGKTVDGVAIGFREVIERTPALRKEVIDLMNNINQMGGPGQGGITWEQALDAYVMGLDDFQKAAIFASPLFGQLTEDGLELRQAFREMALEIPISVNELSRVGQVAGQLGVPADQIEEFTRIVALMGVTTDLSAEDAAFAFARFGNIMGVEAEDLSEFAAGMGNAIVALGNNAAATEPEITNLAMRIAGAGQVVGLTAPEILGISTTLAEMGVRAEMGGSAVSRILQEMFLGMAEGGEAAQEFANIAGMSVDEFAATLEGDPVEAMTIFLDQLSRLQDEGKLTEDQLLAMGLSGIRVRDVMNRLGPNVGNMTENIALATRAWEEQIALQEEAEKRFVTIRSQIQLVKNAFVDLGITLFDLYREDIANFVEGLREMLNRFKDLAPETQKTIVKFALLAAALGPALIILGSMAQGLGVLTTAFGGLLKVITGIVPMLVKMVPVLFSLAPILLPLIAIVGGLYLAFKTNFLGIADLVNHVVNVFKFAGIPDLIRQIVDQLTSGDFVGAWDTFKTATELAINAVKNYIIPAVKEWFTTTITTIQTEAPKVKAEIVAKVSEWADEFIDWIPGAVTDLSNELGKIKDEIVKWIGEQNFDDKIAEWTDDFTTWARDKVAGPVAEELGKIDWQAELSRFGNILLDILEAIGSGAVDFLSWVKRNVVYPVVEKLIGIDWKHQIGVAGDVLVKIFDAIADSGIDFLSWVKFNIVYPLVEKISSIDWKAVLGAVDDVLTKILAAVADLGLSALDFAAWAYENIATKIAEVLEDDALWQKVGEKLYEAAKLILGGMILLPAEFVTWVDDNMIKPIADGLLQVLRDPAKIIGILDAGTELVSRLGEGMMNVVFQIANGFIGALVTDMVSVMPGWLLQLLGISGGPAPNFNFPMEASTTPQQGAWDRFASQYGIDYALAELGPRPAGFAFGGAFRRGMPFIAGENGQEMIFPSRGGFVASNHFLRNLANTMMNPTMAGGYNRYNNVYNPIFNTSPTRELVQTNQDMYSDWVISGMANR